MCLLLKREAEYIKAAELNMWRESRIMPTANEMVHCYVSENKLFFNMIFLDFDCTDIALFFSVR